MMELYTAAAFFSHGLFLQENSLTVNYRIVLSLRTLFKGFLYRADRPSEVCLIYLLH